ncbi:NADP-dependent 3-hydroxy acid dehydrogenase YdfG [Streptomyces sp. SAI-208]|jgi:NADP-dependent 3-hydroxy acid dehydrogenase YdfG|uniref:SDR family oxidoreductase n=1 Tax=unclassified Streptomyces TaxID=2593676 RepID=UPI002473FAD4|nr:MULTISPECIES: SDR family oxidoreductase [unclassified Streptomyces]MDH6521075.1 NADP-dependent 3-hydroxy acid dehydrogenase YdfG [Streptomyces sp. SAI-090]MDH6553295.1 NADP-dependent 3-hydroxy acid dehydrogenase YdfG [Streptomyces sp. SAI-041]MDH6572378.1 NADP-dependent 3-hydroxy acid dehydrogenase YdfG [Streptomyces sp. SAI-117]MDH6582663.1 NADP-dependent 3-hydroxy acid dehydrogenase YdfG [Streptomyces sp. SAI-133]MDH6612073.1 NADP-dependent 3-hydroxy acid dehydrogenase YdfG [Streptomyces 
MTDTWNLTHRIAVVTGASSGIGAATARRLVAGGASVALLGRREDRLKDLADELARTADGRILPVAVDLTDAEAVAGAAATVTGTLGTVDLVVANAGVMLGAPFERAGTDEWDRMIDVNLRALLHTARAFTDGLLATASGGGRADLVHVGSVGGHLLFPDWSVYCATKAAVAHLTRNLRAELGPRGVRVKNIEPGVTATELGADMRDAGTRESLSRMRAGLTPLTATDIAEAIAFAAAAPPNVNVAEMVVVPVRQG